MNQAKRPYNFHVNVLFNELGQLFYSRANEKRIIMGYLYIKRHFGSGKIVHTYVRLPYTAVSRKVVGKNVHATIPKGNMGHDQYTVPDVCSCRTYFCCFPLALENTFPWPFVPILSNFFEERRTQNHPQRVLGLSRALFPTTFSLSEAELNSNHPRRPRGR